MSMKLKYLCHIVYFTLQFIYFRRVVQVVVGHRDQLLVYSIRHLCYSSMFAFHCGLDEQMLAYFITMHNADKSITTIEWLIDSFRLQSYLNALMMHVVLWNSMSYRPSSRITTNSSLSTLIDWCWSWYWWCCWHVCRPGVTNNNKTGILELE